MEFETPRKVQLADNGVLDLYGKGALSITVYDGSQEINLNLSNVLCVPKIKKLLHLSTLKGKVEECASKNNHSWLPRMGHCIVLGTRLEECLS